VSYAIVDPRAVVVHFKNAVAAIAAMMRTGGFPGISDSALTTSLNANVFCLKWRFQTFLQPSGVSKCRPLVGDDCHQAAEVKSEEVVGSPSIEW